MDGRRGFWSYVRDDDRIEGGRITELSRQLADRIRLITGSPFPIFVDRESLGWGDDWESRIDEALLSTTFFIPVITPSYFQSASCRRELLKFSSAAQALGLEELVLPIYYVTVDDLEQPPSATSDQVVQLVRQYQWEDWRTTALEEPTSGTHRKAVHRLATQLIACAESADAKPTARFSGPPERGDKQPANGPHGDEDPGNALSSEDEDLGGEDDADGVLLAAEDPAAAEEAGRLEILAEGEEAMLRLPQRINGIPPLLSDIAKFAEDATNEIKRGDAQGRGFAGRLVASRKLATRLQAPAAELSELVSDYLNDLISVDKQILLMLRMFRENAAQIPESQDFLNDVQALTEAAEKGLATTDMLATSIRNNAKWSKDLRAPSAQLETALRQLSDSRSIFRGWKSEIAEVRALRPPTEGSGA